MAEAINYALGQWEELNVFSTDGAVPIDNNVSEREMKVRLRPTPWLTGSGCAKVGYFAILAA
jgi:hypothetical protein